MTAGSKVIEIHWLNENVYQRKFIGPISVTTPSTPGVLWAVTQEGALGLANREFMKQINILLSGFLASLCPLFEP